MSIRRILLSTIMIIAGVNAFAQDDNTAEESNWKELVTLDFGFTNTSLSNWAAGGYNTVQFNFGFDVKADYAKDLTSWNNRLQLQYGFLVSGDKPGIAQKTNDLVYLESKWGYNLAEGSKWRYTASYDFRSQFTDSYKYGNPKEGIVDPKKADDYIRTLQSGLFSPAYTNIALGIEWKPCDHFDMNFAPLTGGFTICSIPELRKQYGMELKDENIPDVFRSARFQFGAQLKANADFSIKDNFKFETQLVLFSDYLNHPKNLRVNWDNKISWQLTKLFKIAFNSWMIYDPIVLIPDSAHPEGIQKVQWKEYLAFTVTYSFNPKSR